MTMDPDKTLEEFFNEILDGAVRDPERAAELRHWVDNLETWHGNRGFLPRWPIGLSGSRAHDLHVTDSDANSSARAELIGLMARMRASIEVENRYLYLTTLGAFRSWLNRFGASE